MSLQRRLPGACQDDRMSRLAGIHGGRGSLGKNGEGDLPDAPLPAQFVAASDTGFTPAEPVPRVADAGRVLAVEADLHTAIRPGPPGHLPVAGSSRSLARQAECEGGQHRAGCDGSHGSLPLSLWSFVMQPRLPSGT